MDPNTTTEKKESSTSPTELFSSVQVLGQAAVSTYNKESDKVDKAKAAGAAEDILQAASQYGKLEDSSYGKYVDKAEEYLHQYSEPGATKETTEAEQVKTATPAPKDGGADEPEKKEESGGGFGGALNMAKGFLK